MAGVEKPESSVKNENRESINNSIPCPVLTANNYNSWSVRIRAVFRVRGILEAIESKGGKGVAVVDSYKDDTAVALLLQSIPEELVLQVSQLTTVKEIWEALKTRYVGVERVREARLETLLSEFEALKMSSSDSLDNFAAKLQQYVSNAGQLGHVFEERKLVQKFLRSLPSKYITIVATIQQFGDLKNMTFQEAIGRLKTFDEALGSLSKESTNESLMFQKTHHKKGGKVNYNSPKNYGKKVENPKSHNNNEKGSGNIKKGKGKDRSKVQCYRCDQFGHFASMCPERKQKKQEANFMEETDENPAVFMVRCDEEKVFLNEERVIPKKFQSEPKDKNVWYLDNGASNHMTGNRMFFSELNERITGKVKFGDDSCVDIHGKGSILFEGKNGEQRLMTNVYFIPELRNNIISLGQTTEGGCEKLLKGNHLFLHDHSGRLLMKVPRTKNRLYKINLKIGSPVCLQAKIDDSSWLWHARLGHISFETMKKMAAKDLVIGVPRINLPNKLCDSCMVGKQTRLPFPIATTYRASKPLELIYGDLCGPITPSTIGGNEYIFVIIDDYSRYMWSFMLKRKDQAFEVFKSFKVMIEKETERSIKTFRTDRGGEFTSSEFSSFCKENGIQRQLTAPYTPQQNGVVERRNRTILEMTRSIMKAKKVPNYMWGEGVRHATYLINRVPTRALTNKTPYEVFKGRKPNLSHIRVFGCVAYMKITKPNPKKLDDRSKIMIHLGNESGSKAYRLYDPTSRKIHICQDVHFEEQMGWLDLKNVDHSEWETFNVNWGEDVLPIHDGPITNHNFEEGDKSSNSSSIDRSNISSKNKNCSSSLDPSIENPTIPLSPNLENVMGSSDDEDQNHICSRSSPVITFDSEASSQQTGLRRSTRSSKPPAKLNDFIIDGSLFLTQEGEPSSVQEALEKREWLDAMKVEMDSIEKNKVWDLVHLPQGQKTIGLEWVFKLKKNPDGTPKRYRARLVAKGYIQQFGIDYEEVFSPVARLETVRLIMALAASEGWELHHLDVKAAFLHGDLNELIYVEQPKAFEIRGKERMVYKLKKALYGLKQASRAWNAKLDGVLKNMGFQRCTYESAVYIKGANKSLLIVAVYVDDLLVTGSRIQDIVGFKKQMKVSFEMSDLGLLTYYLGIEVKQDKDGVFLKQEGYVNKILKEARLDECNPTHCPMEPGTQLDKDEQGQAVDLTTYRRFVGCLRYLLHTRPDLSFSVGVISRYMQEPKQSHMQAMKHVLRFIKGTKDHGIMYKRGRSAKGLVGFCDSSHNTDRDDGRSTTGYVFYYNGGPISWCSQKQDIVALSSCEAEFMAANAAACQAIWLRGVLSEVTKEEEKVVPLMIDNKSAIELIKHPVFFGRAKHIRNRYHFIRERVEANEINVEHVSGEEQKADILTKPLASIKFKEMKSLLRVGSLSNSVLRIRGVIVELTRDKSPLDKSVLMG
ncbi:hypothetical protein QVD17_29300 [Tagetes erecta]|uniref:Polyprotein n=1 Tax=Tagetes erecta TaxID=13708 RepID=A0AAD8NL10_TARER|nr:hypothetical protein QVD17_29300 [Tagetes erecta]